MGGSGGGGGGDEEGKRCLSLRRASSPTSLPAALRSRSLQACEPLAWKTPLRLRAPRTMEPTASGVFCSRVLSMVNSEDVNAIILAQKNMLDRFEKTNEMLLNFNNLSSVRMQQMNERFLHHTRTLVEMKKDLDSIFRRIRTLKGKLAKQYPDAFSNIHESPILEDDDFTPIPKSTATTIATSEQSTESCDTSPDIISPATSHDFEDLSQGPYDSLAMNGQSVTDDDNETD